MSPSIIYAEEKPNQERGAAMRINGELMSKDKVISKVENNRFEAKNAALLPLFFKRAPDIEGWLEGRAIDRRRTNSWPVSYTHLDVSKRQMQL